MNRTYVEKGVAVAVILLFIGFAFAPSINANISKASLEDELVEITTEVCGLNGGKHTVSLSKEDAEEVEQLIDDIERRLDEVETREEAVEIFNEAIVELDKYGLLGRLSVKQAQKLVNGRYQDNLNKVLDTVQRFDIFADFFNIFCLLSAKVTYPGYYYYESIMMPFGLSFMVGFAPAMLLSAIGFENLATLLLIFTVIISFANPIRIMNLIIFLYCDFDIDTIGLKGFVSSDKTNIFGFFGFTGLMLNGLGEETYFLGSSLAVA